MDIEVRFDGSNVDWETVSETLKVSQCENSGSLNS